MAPRPRRRMTLDGRLGHRISRALLFIALVLLTPGPLLRDGDGAEVAVAAAGVPPADGPANLAEGRRLFQLGKYDEASTHFWRAVLHHADSGGAYELDEAFSPFLRCYMIQGKTADGLFFIASESYQRGQDEMGKLYLEQTLQVDPSHAGALNLQRRLSNPVDINDLDLNDGGGDDEGVDEYGDLSAEELYNRGTDFFNKKNHVEAAKVFDKSCRKSKGKIGLACTNAVYCRTNVMDWGEGGAQFERDMKVVERITELEASQHRSVDAAGTIHWKRSTSAHPHMMLGYPINSMLKRYVAESFAVMDEMYARINESGTGVEDLPLDLPFDQDDNRAQFVFANTRPGFRIRVGFVASGFNSKAVLYLSHDMFRFFDPEKFEVHIFSMGPPDNPMFIAHAMRGVDWRERVKLNVDVFHDVQHLKGSHVDLARYIHEREIHILIEWDGYARQGERAQGLFALRPAPVQILHQEFLGTSGAQYVDYIVTDQISSPEHLEELYTEKFIYMPNHFFSKGHAMQAEVKKPTTQFSAAKTPYKLGTGSPQENRCLAPVGVGPDQPSFVFCNFNKFLKNNPETVRSWIRILREVPDSSLCLLENPTEGIPYLRKFINEETVDRGDGEDLNSRINFLPWQANPFDHQMRSQDFCNVMLDSYPYNGHTTAQDSLYGGVPIVTRSDGDDMSSRVSTSANVVLGLEELNAPNGPGQYEDVAIQLGTNATFFQSVRTRLIAACLQRNPMHPYWDVPRYVRNFESGLRSAWDRYLSGGEKVHIIIVEDDDTKRGTFDDDIVARENVRKKLKSSGGVSQAREEL